MSLQSNTLDSTCTLIKLAQYGQKMFLESQSYRNDAIFYCKILKYTRFLYFNGFVN